MKVLALSLLGLSSTVIAQEPLDAPENCQWGPELDAVTAAPNNHKVILENEHVRVLEVTVQPHTVEPIHAHCWPSTLYIQEATDIIDRDATGKIVFDTRKLPVKPKAPFARWVAPQPPHSIENVGDMPFKLIRVEHKD